eukprot:SAG31_NODE_14020_length_831_cov_1.234973_1_plen_139_part_00
MELPVVELQAEELPVVELQTEERLPVAALHLLPVAELPVAELPVAELPVAELPVAELPVVDALHPFPQSGRAPVFSSPLWSALFQGQCLRQSGRAPVFSSPLCSALFQEQCLRQLLGLTNCPAAVAWSRIRPLQIVWL